MPSHRRLVLPQVAGVEELLGGGLPVDFVDHNNTSILMAAAAAGSSGVVELCLRKGANLKRSNAEGRTALHVGAVHKHIALTLLGKGAEAGVLDSNVSVRSPLPLAPCN